MNRLLAAFWRPRRQRADACLCSARMCPFSTKRRVADIAVPIDKPSSSLVESQGVEGGRREEEVEQVEQVEQRLQGEREPRPAKAKTTVLEEKDKNSKENEEMISETIKST